MKVTAGKVLKEDKQRLAEEQQSEEKRLAIMMMKKREKYLYQKIMFGKKRKIRQVQFPAVLGLCSLLLILENLPSGKEC